MSMHVCVCVHMHMCVHMYMYVCMHVCLTIDGMYKPVFGPCFDNETEWHHLLLTGMLKKVLCYI